VATKHATFIICDQCYKKVDDTERDENWCEVSWLMSGPNAERFQKRVASSFQFCCKEHMGDFFFDVKKGKK
jgi:hypothetical protein